MNGESSKYENFGFSQFTIKSMSSEMLTAEAVENPWFFVEFATNFFPSVIGEGAN